MDRDRAVRPLVSSTRTAGHGFDRPRRHVSLARFHYKLVQALPRSQPPLGFAAPTRNVATRRRPRQWPPGTTPYLARPGRLQGPPARIPTWCDESSGADLAGPGGAWWQTRGV